jgi:adenylate kinase
VKTRLKAYHTQTSPLIAYYREQGKVAMIHGEAAIEDVSRQIDEVFAETVAE